MTEIGKPEELVAIAVRQGMELGLTEATIVLGYMEAHEYCLMAGDDFAMALHDVNDEDGKDDMPYDIRQVIQFCQEMNEELLLENSSKAEPDHEYLLELRKDEIILGMMLKRAEQFIPPVLREYSVVIVEHLKMVVPVEAASWAEAEMKAREAWKAGEYILDASHFAGVSFTYGG